MEPSEKTKKIPKKWICIGIVIVAAVICGIIIFVSSRSKSADSAKKDDNTSVSDTNENTHNSNSNPSGTAVDDNTDAAHNESTLSVEEAPEATLDPLAADVTIEDSDPEPEVELKQHQQAFVESMEAEDYDAAKKVLDDYFATSEYAIAGVSGGNTFDNYVYYYEKQRQYEESAKFQIDYLEKYIGLDNIVEANIRYQHLLETLKYVTIDDARLAQIQNSVDRWNEMQTLLDNGDTDTCISKLKELISNGLECIYAYNYLTQAYNQKKDYLSEAKAYYIELLKLQDNEENLNLFEQQFYLIFHDRMNSLYDLYLITDEEKEFIQNEVTIDTAP